MCVAIACTNENRPSLEILKACEESNQDGGGVAWLEKGSVLWKKGITADEIHEILTKAKGPAFAHFRISTVGGNGKGLCHPFPIHKDVPLALAGKAPAVLMHNGTWSNWRETILRLQPSGRRFPEGAWSDSRGMAYLAAHYGPNILTLVNEKIGVLHGSGKMEFFGTGWEEETKDSGIWYSNTHWKWKFSKRGKKDKYYGYPTPYSWDGDTEDLHVKVSKSESEKEKAERNAEEAVLGFRPPTNAMVRQAIKRADELISDAKRMANNIREYVREENLGPTYCVRVACMQRPLDGGVLCAKHKDEKQVTSVSTICMATECLNMRDPNCKHNMAHCHFHEKFLTETKTTSDLQVVGDRRG